MFVRGGRFIRPFGLGGKYFAGGYHGFFTGRRIASTVKARRIWRGPRQWYSGASPKPPKPKRLRFMVWAWIFQKVRYENDAILLHHQPSAIRA
eukprot:scaffold61129_cov23-Cyclotella_meneghiniana.AAC.3